MTGIPALHSSCVNIEKAHRDLISGRVQGAGPAIKRSLLHAVASFYAAVLRLRSFSFRLPFRTRRVHVPVISIGNITTGGTGKTPMTAWVTNHLIEQGHRPAIAMRGYRPHRIRYEPSQLNEALADRRIDSDEAQVLLRHCPAATVLINPDRVAAAQSAVSSGTTCIVLDDGFQHRRLYRDLDIVLIDASCPFGFGHLLPRGLLREPLSALRRAQAIVLTRCDQVSAGDLESIESMIHRASPVAPILRCRHEITDFIDLKGRAVNHIDLTATQALIFAGIANFDSFCTTVERLGVRILAKRQFSDHHDYTESEIAELAHLATSLEANALLTTEKDAVKLVDRWPADVGPVLVPRVGIAFEGDGAAVMVRLLDSCITAPSKT